MRLEKELKIAKVEATNAGNAPFRIFLEGENFSFKKETVLTMNAITCARYGIPMSLEIVGEKLICFLENQLKINQTTQDIETETKINFIPPHGKKIKISSVEEKINDDELTIKSLKKKETYYYFGGWSPIENKNIKRILELISFGAGDGMHFHIMPCPFYHLFLDLTEEEFEECKKLTGDTVFQVNFKLKTT